MQGKQSVKFEKSPHIIEGASIVGKKEGEGPLGKLFVEIEEDPMFGGEIIGRMQKVGYKQGHYS